MFIKLRTLLSITYIYSLRYLALLSSSSSSSNGIPSKNNKPYFISHTYIVPDTYYYYYYKIISFMQGIYTYIPEMNYVPREYSVAAIQLLLFMVHGSLAPVLNLLYFYISNFQSMCTVPNMAVFCSSLTSWFPGMLLMYFQNDFEIDPVTPIITGITFVFTFHSSSSLMFWFIYVKNCLCKTCNLYSFFQLTLKSGSSQCGSCPFS
jgi:hypothetical protein